jgi:integrase
MGRPEIRFHDLRHAFATNLFHQSVPVKDVSATLGHSTEAFTMRVTSTSFPTFQHVVGRAVTAIYG